VDADVVHPAATQVSQQPLALINPGGILPQNRRRLDEQLTDPGGSHVTGELFQTVGQLRLACTASVDVGGVGFADRAQRPTDRSSTQLRSKVDGALPPLFRDATGIGVRVEQAAGHVVRQPDETRVDGQALGGCGIDDPAGDARPLLLGPPRVEQVEGELHPVQAEFLTDERRPALRFG